jgi:DNA mismatch repair ATPase MutL
MNLEEREKDQRTQEYIDYLLNELKVMLETGETELKPIISVFDYRNPRRTFKVRGVDSWERTVGTKDPKRQGDWIPTDMVINLHTIIKKIATKKGMNYNPDEYGFPMLYINLNGSEIDLRYSPKYNKIMLSYPQEDTYNAFRKYQKRMNFVNPIEIFYTIVRTILYEGDIPSQHLVHEVSHMFDNMFEFDFSVFPDQDVEKSDEEMTDEEWTEYLNEEREIEARIREVVFNYYKNKEAIFKYIAIRVLNDQEVNDLISDVIKDMLNYYQTTVLTKEGKTIWDLYTEKTKKQVLLRFFSVIDDLISKEAQKLV